MSNAWHFFVNKLIVQLYRVSNIQYLKKILYDCFDT